VTRSVEIHPNGHCWKFLGHAQMLADLNHICFIKIRVIIRFFLMLMAKEKKRIGNEKINCKKFFAKLILQFISKNIEFINILRLQSTYQ